MASRSVEAIRRKRVRGGDWTKQRRFRGGGGSAAVAAVAVAVAVAVATRVRASVEAGDDVRLVSGVGARAACLSTISSNTEWREQSG